MIILSSHTSTKVRLFMDYAWRHMKADAVTDTMEITWFGADGQTEMTAQKSQKLEKHYQRVAAKLVAKQG